MKEGKNNKVKLALVISAILFVPMLYPQTISKAQNKITPAEVDTTSIRVKAIDAEKDQKLDSARKEASVLPAMINTLASLKTSSQRASIRVKVIKPIVALRYNGEIFEIPDIQAYKGYLIVNLDSFLSKVDTANVAISINDTCLDESDQSHLPKKKSWLRRLFSHQ